MKQSPLGQKPRLFERLLAAIIGLLLCSPVSNGQVATEKPTLSPAPPAAKILAPYAYYSKDDSFEEKVQLSPEMTAKLFEIIKRKPEPWMRTLKVAPRGYFKIGDKSYAYFGFITTDASRGDSWDDPALGRFWEALNKAEDKIDQVKDFEP